MWQSIWLWVQGLHGPASTIVGTAIGSFLALLSLTIAALFNAHLNRRRDDRIRRGERRALAIALRVELAGIARTLEENAKDVREAKSDFLVPDVRHSVRVLPELISKLGLLGPEAIQKTLDA